MSEILWFHDSEIPSFCQNLRFLLNNFDSFCPILFTFTPHLNHQTMHVWKENQGSCLEGKSGLMFWRKIGAEGSVLQELLLFVILTIRSLSTFQGFFSITLTAFVWFCSYLHHTITIRQCMFERKIGAEGSVLQALGHFVILTIRCLYYDW